MHQQNQLKMLVLVYFIVLYRTRHKEIDTSMSLEVHNVEDLQQFQQLNNLYTIITIWSSYKKCTTIQHFGKGVLFSGPPPPIIQKGDPRSPIPPCVMAPSAIGLKLGVVRSLLTTRAKQMRPQFVCCVKFYACSSSHSDRSRCRWHTHLANHGYFDYKKNPKNPNLSSMLG